MCKETTRLDSGYACGLYWAIDVFNAHRPNIFRVTMNGREILFGSRKDCDQYLAENDIYPEGTTYCQAPRDRRFSRFINCIKRKIYQLYEIYFFQ